MTQPNTKTPAMVLQEFTVRHGFSPPEYILAHSKAGTHENEFNYRVCVANVVGAGFGRSKQVAKHNAASKALEILAEKGQYDPVSDPAEEFHAQSHRNESDSPMKPAINSVGRIKDICFEQKLPYPVFVEISDVGPPHCRQFTYECQVGSVVTQAIANTKKQAKQLAARDMLEKIVTMYPEAVETDCSNALLDKDQEAIAKRNEIVYATSLGMVPNRMVQIEDYTETIRNIMKDKRLTFEQFDEHFCKRDPENLDQILSTLEIKHKIETFQDNPPIMVAMFDLETPMTLMGFGRTKDEAEKDLMKQIFDTLVHFMSPIKEEL